MNELFYGIFSTGSQNISVSNFLICIAAALLCGAIFAAADLRSGRAKYSFSMALALLPAAVCTVIMMVNGNVGTGVAVAGA